MCFKSRRASSVISSRAPRAPTFVRSSTGSAVKCIRGSRISTMCSAVRRRGRMLRLLRNAAHCVHMKVRTSCNCKRDPPTSRRQSSTDAPTIRVLIDGRTKHRVNTREFQILLLIFKKKPLFVDLIFVRILPIVVFTLFNERNFEIKNLQ